MKTTNMGNRVRVGALLTMFVVATLMLVMTNATPALATGSTTASFEANSYEFSVNENTTANTVVGTVAATDPDGDSLTYSVGGTDAANFNEVFALNTSAGEITVKPGATINYESGAPTSYQVNIMVTDGEDDSGATQSEPTTDSTVAVRIRIRNVDEPGRVTLSTSSPQEGVQLRATLYDPDGRLGGSTCHGGRGATMLLARSSSPPQTTKRTIASGPIRRRQQTGTCTLSSTYDTLIALVTLCPLYTVSQTDALRARRW